MLFAKHWSGNWANVAILLLFIVVVGGCKITKLVPEGELLLQKNKIEGNQNVSSSELQEQIKHDPNRRLIFFKFHLWAYQAGLKKIGEPPVLLDSAKVQRSANNMQIFLFKKGYFDNEVSYEVKKKKHAKRAKVIYHIEEGEAYTIKTVTFKIQSGPVEKVLENTRYKTNIAAGNILDYDKLAAERYRINDHLREHGYYKFNRSLIDFGLDTAAGNHEVAVVVNIFEDELERQKRFRIGKVWTEIQTNQEETDTIIEGDYHYMLHGMDLRTLVLSRSISFKSGQLFRQSHISSTYERMLGLGLFESVDVQVKPINDEQDSILDVYVRLVASPKHDLIWEPQIVTTEQRFNENISTRNYGLANELTLKNKNVFQNGEEFNIRLRTALETQFGQGSNAAFSTFLQEVNTELKFPHLLSFNNLSDKFRSRSTSTRLSLSYLYEKNPVYTRHLMPFNYTYEFVQKRGAFYWTPFLVSLNKASFNPEILQNLNPDYVEAQKRLFTNNLITSHKFSGVLSNRSTRPTRYWYLNSNFLEVAGVFLPQLTDYGDKLGVNHSTFVRSDVDLRYNRKITENHAVVVRFFGGLGVPVGANSILPYERRFFSGGSNSLRGWRLRTVGPGSFQDSTSNIQFTRSGELSLTGNIEYRFGIIESAIDIEGAFFVDAGNVWNLKKDTLFEGGEFQIKDFYKEFAINSGLGLRFDFDFLLLRFDWGVQLVDPNHMLGSRWVFNQPWKKGWFGNHTVWNVAVGYPF
jgi:outer membrane protein assembly factor BamA